MTPKQASAAACEAMAAIGVAFNSNGRDCKEAHALINTKHMAIGFARLMLQASWLDFNANQQNFKDCFRDTTYAVLYQFYLKQKPKRKKKIKK